VIFVKSIKDRRKIMVCYLHFIHDQHPWNAVCVDLIGPWKIPDQNRLILALTCIDPCTRYLEIGLLSDKTGESVSFLFDYQWLYRFPRPLLECLHDNGSEFVSMEFHELLQIYGVVSRVTADMSKSFYVY
jgi:Integrase core domain.